MRDYEEQKSYDCMKQHLKTFFKQSAKEELADFGEPCSICSYAGKCNYDWLSIMEQLLNKSAVKITMVYSEL